MSAEFRGAWYKRVRSKDFRNRNTGVVIKNVKVKKRVGKRNKAVFFDGRNFKAIEPTYHHVYSFDRPPKRPLSAKKKFEVSVRENPMWAKKRRKAHKRRIR